MISGGEIAGGQLGIVAEEAFAVDEDAGHRLPGMGDIAAIIHLHPRHLFEQVFRYRIGFDGEHAGIVFRSILLDPHGRALDDRCLQHVIRMLHIKGVEVDHRTAVRNGKTTVDGLISFVGNE